MNKDWKKVAFIISIMAVLLIILIITGILQTYDTHASGASSGNSELLRKLDEIVLIKETDSIDKDKIISIIKGDLKNKVSAGENSDTDELGVQIYWCMIDVLPSLSCAGKNGRYEIDIKKIPKDPLFSSPEYLGRENIATITFTGINKQGTVSGTAWWYTKDATKIAKSVFESISGSKTGVLRIVFSEPESGEEVALILNSRDAEQIRPYWGGDESSLRLSDWSFYSTKNLKLVMYEDPSTALSLNPEILSKTGYDYYFEEPDLPLLVKESSDRLLESVHRVSTAINDNNHDKIISTSKDILELCCDEKEIFSRLISQNKGSKEIKNYISAIDCISNAGSDYWYGSVSMNKSIVTRGNSYYLQGVEILKNLNETASALKTRYDLVPDVSPVPLNNCYSLNTPVHYRDASECNDVSVNVKSCRMMSSLSLKDGETVREVKPGYGKMFVAVVVDIYHLGYRGGGTSVLTTPSKNDFTFIYEGSNYKDITPGYYIRNVGEVYSQKKLQRLEKYESNLIYEISCPSGFEPGFASLKLNLGSKWGEHIWNFRK